MHWLVLLTKVVVGCTLLGNRPYSTFYASDLFDKTKLFMHHLPCLLLIRHAQSENNAFPDHLRVSDPNITALGVAQAKKLAEAVQQLKPSVLYCSAFLRSLETTRPIAQLTGMHPFVRQDIYEQGGCHRGYLPNQRIAEAGMNRERLSLEYKNWRLDDRITSKGWFDLDHYETQAEASERAARVRGWFESETGSHSREDRVAMVIHADFKIRLLEAFLEDSAIEHKLGDVVNTSISRLSKVSGRWKLDYWNVHSHLDATEISV